MTNEELASIIDQLALEVVLIDHSDTDEMRKIITFFKQIHEWADSRNQGILIAVTSACIKLLNTLIDRTAVCPEASFSIINNTISEIQSHARNNFLFDSMSLPKGLNLTQESPQKKPINTETTFSLSSDNNNQSNPDSGLNNHQAIDADSKTGLRHPDKLPVHLDNKLFAEFLSLQDNTLDKMEALILSVEEKNDAASITELKRMVHTTKGEAGFLNLNELETLCHMIEDILGDESPSIHTDIFLNAVDWMRKAFSWYMGGDNKPGSSSSIIESIEKCCKKRKALTSFDKKNNDIERRANELSEKLANNPSLLSNTPELYDQFILKINKSIDASARYLTALLSMIKNLNNKRQQPPLDLQQILLKFQYYITKISAVADFLSLKEIRLLTGSTQDLLDKMLTDSHYCHPAFVELLAESFTALKEHNRWLESALTRKTPIEYDKSFPYLLAKLQASLQGLIPAPAPDKRVSSGKPIKSCDDRSEKTDALPEDQRDLSPKKPVFPVKNKSLNRQIKESINVDAERLDRIIDMIGELVIAESMVIQAEEIKKIESQELSRHLSQMNKITRELQETGLSLRMLPIKSTFQKMARIARDTAKKSGKKIKFIMQGEETELDKTVVDKIGDPLLHMIRNAIDHGIEKNSDERLKNNKPETGSIIVKAFHNGGNIHIEIRDDGQGLNKQGIIEKAIEHNLIRKGEVLNDREIYNLIFEPGFSTADEISDLSGRGVGMNVVKNSIESLHGRIDIKSIPGKGSVFTIKIPLTLAIIDGMVVKSNNQRYIIPTLSIITSSKLNKNKVTSILKKREMVNVHGKLIPLFLLSHLFGTTSETENKDHGLMVVVEEESQEAAIVVDELLGKQQIVIKPLGESLKNIPGISGGAIMPDGRVGLIIDVAGLIRLSHSRSETASSSPDSTLDQYRFTRKNQLTPAPH